MARDDKGSDKGRVKVRVIEFELEGSNQTLRDSIRDITQAIGRTPTLQLTRQVTSPAAKALVGGAVDEVAAEGGDPPVDSQEFEGEAPTRDSKPRRFRTPKIISVDLRQGQVPLKAFLQQAAPTSDAQKFLLITYWMKTYRDVPEVTADHIYTCYREMGWTNIPPDASSPLRALRQQGWLEKGEAKGAYRLNHVGEGKAQDLVDKKAAAV